MRLSESDWKQLDRICEFKPGDHPIYALGYLARLVRDLLREHEAEETLRMEQQERNE